MSLFEDRWEKLKKKGSDQMEKNFWRGLLLSLKSLLPEEAGQIIDEFADPKNLEPMLFKVFLLLFKTLEIPPHEIQFVIGYNGNVQRMKYCVQVINVHDGEWKTIEFPAADFLSNVLNSEKRLHTAQAARQTIMYFRFFKKADDGPLFLPDGSINGAALTKDGAPLQLEMNNQK